MAKESALQYVCSECGHVESKWNGRCPECGAWNSFVEEKVVQRPKAASNDVPVMDDSVRRLSDIPIEESMRVSSGMEELDRVLGGGVMRPSSVLVGGEPGIGKSTIMIQMLSCLSGSAPVLYVSGEESPSQVRMRSDRLKLRSGSISVFCDTRLEALSEAIERVRPGYIVIDSLQTLYSASLLSMAGSPNQVRACCMEISLIAKKIGAAVFFVGHVTKDGNIAGPKIVEHMVDTVLYFESAESGLRLLRASKNRFGSVDEIGLFTMDGEGLHGVKDPSSAFISRRAGNEIPSGIAFTPVIEGSRVFIVEIQALVVPAKGSMQRIYSDRIDSARVSRVAAILERHAGLMLSDHDIYVNVGGGMKLSEVSIELALAIALYSSRMDVPVPGDLAAFGELSLAGEVRPVSSSPRRMKALSDMGFGRALTTDSKACSGTVPDNIRDIKQAILSAFSRRK